MRGDGGAYVGAHDDTDSLRKLDYAGIDKTHGDNRGCTGALHQRRDYGAQQYAFPNAAGEFFKDLRKLSARNFFKACGKAVHSVKEQRQTARGRKRVMKCVQNFFLRKFIVS